MANPRMKVIISIVLFICFVGSVAWSVFSGDEFKTIAKEDPTKGLMKINVGLYSQTYLAGDTFVFDKEGSVVSLVAKDPRDPDLVRVDDLPSYEYGFLINGEGTIIVDPSEIVMTPDIEKITVVSIDYPDLQVDIPVNVISELDSSKLVNNLVLEAESAKIYQNGVLLSNKDLETLPNPKQPYSGIAGSDPAKDPVAEGSWSGGNILRSLEGNNMEIRMEILAAEECDVQLEIVVCMCRDPRVFGEYFAFTVNGERISALDNSAIPKDPAKGYYATYTIPAVTVHLDKGINLLSFKCGEYVNISKTINIDAVRITANAAVLTGAE
jgi:hypothetical protein